MITLTQNKTLGTGDLSIAVRDANGALYDPATITYSIFTAPDVQGNQTLVGAPNLTPTRATLGQYFVSMTIPTGMLGQFQLVWSLQQYAITDPVDTIKVDFTVINIDPLAGSFEAPSAIIAARTGVSQRTAELVMYVRELLSDTNPDRNYHFRPPTPGKVVAGFNTRMGFVWTDSTILRMLDISIAQLNTWNTKNLYSFNVNTLPDDWGKCAAIGAASKCLMGESARWTADEFGYSLNGVSLDLHKADGYRGLAESYKQEFETWAPLITANRPFSAGLRQQRWLLG